MLDSLKCFVEKRAFQNESAFQEIQLRYMYVLSRHQGYRIALLDFKN